MDLAFIAVFPECQHSKGYFWESRSCVFGGRFPSPNFQLSRSPSGLGERHGKPGTVSTGLCLSQRQRSVQPAWLQGASRTRAALWRFQDVEGHPTAPQVLQKPLLGPGREQERETLAGTDTV